MVGTLKDSFRFNRYSTYRQEDRRGFTLSVFFVYLSGGERASLV